MILPICVVFYSHSCVITFGVCLHFVDIKLTRGLVTTTHFLKISSLRIQMRFTDRAAVTVVGRVISLQVSEQVSSWTTLQLLSLLSVINPAKVRAAEEIRLD